MRLSLAFFLVICATGLASAQETPTQSRTIERNTAPAFSSRDVDAVAPALGDYTERVLAGDLWRRTDLSLRDRSIVTVAALIVGGHTASMLAEFNRALDYGVTPAELSEILTHLAFYAGWPSAMSAAAVVRSAFAERGIAPTSWQVRPISWRSMRLPRSSVRPTSPGTSTGWRRP